MTSWTLNGALQENYTYDPVTGNLQTKGGAALTYGDPAHAHAVTKANANTYSYDANGNQTSRVIGSDTFNLLYDAENRVVKVQKNGATSAQFTYDGDGARVMAVENGQTTTFVGAHYEKTGAQITKYYFAGSTRIAMRKYTIPQNMTVEYMLSDHLGSTSLTTDTNGAKVLELRYKAWGEIRASWTASPSTTPAYRSPLYTYTGQASYMDDPTTTGVAEGFGLMFYNARWYDPYLNHFTQPDSIVPTSTQGTQAYDRYAYSNNNPVRYMDPSGHSAWESDDGNYDGEYIRQRQDALKCQGGNDTYCSYGELHPVEVAAWTIGGLVVAAVLAEVVAPVAIDDMLAASEASTVLNYTPVDLALSGEYDAYGEVFYSGARRTAESWASANGGVTLGQTPEGEILAENVKGLDYLTQAKPLWSALSQEFATNASGVVNVFLKAGGLTTDSIWATVEYPTLLSNPFVTSISIYFVP